MTIGIYSIVNKINGKRYIGKSKNIERRWVGHFYELRKPVRRESVNRHLYAAYHKYGRQAFVTEILEKFDVIDEPLIADREVYWIDFFRADDRDYGYNLVKISSSNLTTHPETRKLQSDIRKKMWPKEKREKLSISVTGNLNPNYGKKWSDEQKLEAATVSRNHWTMLSDAKKSEMAKKNSKSGSKHRILQHDKYSGEVIKVWDTMYELIQCNPAYNKSCIYQCCIGNIKTHRGFKWTKELKNEKAMDL